MTARRGVLSRLWGIWEAPDLEGDPDRAILAGWLSAILRGIFTLLAFYLMIVVPFVARNKPVTAALVVALMVCTVGCQVLVRGGSVRLAAGCLVGVFWLVSGFVVAVSGGTQSVTMSLYFTTTTMAGLLLGRRWGWLTLGASAVAGLGICAAEAAGHPFARLFPFSSGAGWTFSTANLVGTIMVLSLSLAGYEKAVALARRQLAQVEAAQAALADSEARYRLLAENSTDVIWLADITPAVLERGGIAAAGAPPQGPPVGPEEGLPEEGLRYRYVSPSVQRLLGFSQQEVLDGPIGFWATPSGRSDRHRVAQSLREQWDAGARGVDGATPHGTSEIELIRSDGSTVWTETAVSLVIGSNGLPESIVGATRDISRRRHAEEELRLLASAMEQAGDALVVLEADLTIRYVNAAVERTTGYSRSELIGKPLGVLIAQGDRALVEEQARAATAGGQPWDGQWSVRRRDGSEVPAEGVLSAVRDPDGNIAHLVVAARDVAGRLALEEQLRQAQKLRAVGQLAAGVAHEFNNLLAGMMMRAERAAMVRRIEDYEKLADLVLRAAERGGDVCRSLTAFARPEPPRREPIPVEVPIERALEVAAHQLNGSEVTVVRDYAAGDSLVSADCGQLEQVFLNLIINACHAMPDGGELRLSTRLEPTSDGSDTVVICVADTGHGIPPESLHRVFEPFFTTKGSLGEGDIPGTGLGLSVSHGIVTAHGGTMVAHSSEAGGAEFEIRFPRDTSGDGSVLVVPRVREEAPKLAEGRSVLLVEDEPDVCDAATDALRDAGCRVVAARTTTAALDELSRRGFDLVVTDLQMPGGGGRAVADCLRDMPYPPPLIVVTGRNDARLEDVATGLPSSVCLYKPVSAAQLVSEVERLLSGAGDG